MKGIQMKVNTLAIALLTLAAANTICASSEAQLSHSPDNTITVTGTSTIQVVPDIIVWSIKTTDESRNLGEAKESSDARLKSVLGLTKELGIREEDIQTGRLTVERKYNIGPGGQRQDLRCFSLQRGVTIKERDLNRFDEYFTKLVSRTEMEVSFEFDSSRMTDLRWEARLKALKIAKEKAEAMVAVLDRKIGKALTIGESGVPSVHRAEVVLASNNNYEMAPAAARTSESADRTDGTFAPGAISVTVSVGVTFTLE
ncbi:MAG: SIMPL domain-containing protein [Candidatus Hydrogenedentes bacterium]|nr:SIMPL domain-containing protein [Candidatus Hydrogenedentota bacterium]